MRRSLSSESKKVLGNMVREHLQNNAVENTRSGEHTLIASAKELAWETKLADSTIYKLHSGEFSMRTLKVVEAVLGVDFIGQLAAQDESVSSNTRLDAPAKATIVRLGGYTEEQIAPYLGRFLTCRRGVTVSTNFLCTMVDISWDEDIQGARFSETNRFVSSYGKQMDYSQNGTVHISPQIGMVHLLTSVNGALRLVTLTRLQVGEPVMYGAILTQAPEAGHYVPVKTTVHYRKIERGRGDEVESLVGPITPEHPAYASLSADLDEAERAILVR